MEKRKPAIRLLVVILLAACLSTGIITAYAKEMTLKIRYQGKSDKDEQTTKPAVPQGMAGNKNTLYLIKTREGKNGNDNKSYIIKVTKADSSSPKILLPKAGVNVGHANGMTYADGWLYIASGDSIYRVKDKGGEKSAFDGSKEWKKGTISYSDPERFTVRNATAENIAHYRGSYYICVTERKLNSSGDRNLSMEFGIGEFQGTEFVITKTFTVMLDTYRCIQDIDYNSGYLYIVTSEKHNDDSKTLNNHMTKVPIPDNYSKINDGSSFEPEKYHNFDSERRKKNGKWEGTIREVESVYVYDGKYYLWSNIISGWNETLCRYKDK